MGTNFGSTIPVIGLNIGFVGQISRTGGNPVIAARQANVSNLINISFGDPVVLIADSTGGTLRNVADFIGQGGTFTADKFAGIAVREVKTQLGYPYSVNSAPPIGYYAAGDMCEALEEGSITVQVNVGTPTSGSPVYVRVALNGGIPAGLVGDLEAAADGANTVVLTNVVFRTGVLDANNVAEITLLTRQAA